MKNITKTLLVLVSSFAISFAATAGELTISGAAKASYAIGGADDSNSKGIGVGNELNATASGELDNGFTWSYSTELDPADGGAATNDDSQLVIGMGGLGTVGFFDSEGGLSQELGYGIGALGTGYDWGSTLTVQAGLDVSSHPNVQYHLPADLLPFGLTAKVGYVPNMTDGQGNSFKNKGPVSPLTDDGNQMTGYAITAKPIDGLTIGADYHETSGHLTTTKLEPSSGNAFAQYAAGNFKIGYSRGGYEPGLTAKNGVVTEYTNTSMGIEFAVNDQLSVSYNDEEFEAKKNVAIAAGAASNTKTTVTTEHESIQVAYNMGGATLGVALVEAKNDDYTAGKDTKMSIFTLAMEF
jgi:hypothetical protein